MRDEPRAPGSGWGRKGVQNFSKENGLLGDGQGSPVLWFGRRGCSSSGSMGSSVPPRRGAEKPPCTVETHLCVIHSVTVQVALRRTDGLVQMRGSVARMSPGVGYRAIQEYGAETSSGVVQTGGDTLAWVVPACRCGVDRAQVREYVVEMRPGGWYRQSGMVPVLSSV